MGHIVNILTFDISTPKDAIQQECDEWGDYNCDPEERGGCYGGLESPIRFTDKTFASFEEARDYLYSTVGSYLQIAVKYKVYPEVKASKTMSDLTARIAEYNRKVAVLNQPHYKGVKQATVKCKACGSSLATRFCGDTYSNACPVCRADLRPQSTLDKLNKYKSTIKDLEKKLKAETARQNQKNESKAKYFWAVCCEVHA